MGNETLLEKNVRYFPWCNETLLETRVCFYGTCFAYFAVASISLMRFS